MKSRTGCLTSSRLFSIGFSQPASLNQIYQPVKSSMVLRYICKRSVLRSRIGICWCSDIGIDDEDEFATKFIYNNGNNASTDNITAGVAAWRRSGKSRREKGRMP